MTGLNRIFLMGFLGSDPKTSLTQKGTPYTMLSIATHRKSGTETERRDATDWHYVRVWGKQGEFCAKFLNKGRAVLVEGYLSQYSMPKEGGKPERRTAINALRVDWLPRLPEQKAAEETEVADENDEATDFSTNSSFVDDSIRESEAIQA